MERKPSVAAEDTDVFLKTMWKMSQPYTSSGPKGIQHMLRDN